ncbi:MAG: TIGR00725 family protein [Myxococcota bacterium]|jgi:uncharacterized protein (TIGR00725 family)|nr:TIGR00725 family protein [Myxococcota bacterium]
MHRPLVAIIGSAKTSPEVIAVAEALGAALAARGLSILCGGRGGVMLGACRGLRQYREQHPVQGVQAVAIGLLPDVDKGLANPFLDFALPTGLGFARNSVIALAADALIAIEGSSGTLSEMAYAWQYGKPLCALDGCGGWAARLAGERLDERRADVIFRASSVDEAAQWALRVLAG